MRRQFVVQFLLAASVAAVPSHAFAQSPETARGKALYEARCNDCHDRSVHTRNPRSAKSIAEIRAFVVRWDRELGGLWQADELDAVTRYLNERYYGFPCPTSLCSLERAGLRTSLVHHRTP
jgi:hypothetical protein